MDKMNRQLNAEEYAFALKKAEEFNSNGKLTVAIFSDVYFPRVDGVLRVVDNVAQRLTELCNVVVFAPAPKDFHTEKNYLYFKVKSHYIKGLGYDLADPDSDERLKKMVDRLKIDVIHVHSPFSMGKFARQVRKKKKCPMVATFHSQYKKDIYKETKSKLLTHFVLKYIMRTFNAATEVWTMHSASARTLMDYGYKGKIFYMPNATDFVYPDGAEDKKLYIKSKHGIKDEKVFLFVGRLVVQKNILFIADVLKVLKADGVKFKMLFVGDGPDRKVLERRVKECGIEKEVVMVGSVSDQELIKDYYLTADLVLFPSKYDVSSIVQIEAAAMKTPCAFVEGSVTSCSVTRDRNGYIFPDDVDGYAKEVERVIKTDGEIERVGANAYNELYVTWDKVVEDSFERYRELIETYKKKTAK